MKTAIIGTGRCGTEAISRWIPDALFEPEHLNLTAWTTDQEAEKIIQRMGAEVIVDHRLAFFIPIVEKIWPACKYLVLRRDRDATIRSMDRWNWYREENHYMRTRHQPPRKEMSHLEKCAWYHDFILERMLRGLELVGSDRQQHIWIETADQNRAAISKWIGREELADTPIARTHSAGSNRTMPHLSGTLGRYNRPGFFCMGAQFSVARWLKRQLCGHPAIRGPIPALGETDDFSVATHFFADEERMAKGMNEYSARFSDDPGLIQGDFTPMHAFIDQTRIEDIAAWLPDLKAIMIVDHPVRRLWTLVLEYLKYRHGQGWSRRLFEPTSREEMIHLITAPWNAESSDYDAALTRWENTLGPQRILTVFHDELTHHPQKALRLMFEHLGLADTMTAKLVGSLPKLLIGPFVSPPQPYAQLIQSAVKKQVQRFVHRFDDQSSLNFYQS